MKNIVTSDATFAALMKFLDKFLQSVWVTCAKFRHSCWSFANVIDKFHLLHVKNILPILPDVVVVLLWVVVGGIVAVVL